MPTDRTAPEEIRSQLAAQLQLDRAHLAAIPPDGLYRLRDQLNVDDLTGVLARRAGLAALHTAIEAVRGSGRPELVVAFLDVDGLKGVNDRRGHPTGDLMLVALAGVLTVKLRAEDILFRYGGDEFVCAMPAMNVDCAGELLREAWHELTSLGWCGFSVGFAELRDGDAVRSLIERADECLYAGRPRPPRRDGPVRPLTER